jgi:protease-4
MGKSTQSCFFRQQSALVCDTFQYCQKPAMSEPTLSSPQQPPQQILVQQPQSAFGRYGKFLILALGFAVMTIIGMSAAYQSYFSPADGPQEKYHSLSKSASDKVAIVDVSGAILEGDGFVKKQLDRIRDDDNVVAVVLRIDSPGGTVTGSDYLYHHVKELAKDRKLPVVVSMGSICASGGYYIAMAADGNENLIFAEPSTWTGSIGVVIPHYDLSGLLAEYQVKDDSIASHKNKLMGSPTRELSPEERAEERKLLQELVDISFARFKEIVADSRPKLKADPALLEKATTGQIFTAEQAMELGLIDKVGFIEEAIERAAELAGKTTKNVRCVKYEEPASFSSLLTMESPASQRVTVDLKAIFDLTVPRAYYVYTTLPGMLNLSQ